jgi:hypothetical protein
VNRDLRQRLDEYLTVRRSLGFRLDDAGRVLSNFVNFATRSGAATVTTELAITWATLPVNASPIWLAHRLSMVRGFARYLQTIDPDTEVPPADLLPAGNYRPPTPYLYSDADIVALMAAARTLTPPVRTACLLSRRCRRVDPGPTRPGPPSLPDQGVDHRAPLPRLCPACARRLVQSIRRPA